MDEQNQNSNNNSNGQGIYSTPDLSVDVDKLAQNTTTSSNQARVASVFANTESGQRSQQLQNAMNAAPRYATEDIHIDTGVKKRSKLPIIIAVLALLIAGGGTAYYFISQQLNQPAEEAPATIAQAKTDFERYATYLLEGESSDELGGEYSPTTTYEIDKALAENNSTYWETAKDLLDKSISTYANAEDHDEDLLLALENYRGFFTFINLERNVTSVTISDILKTYIDSGRDQTINSIENTYATLTESDSNTAKHYAQAKIAQYVALVDTLDFYSDNGCIVDGEVSETCELELVQKYAEELSTLNTTANGQDIIADSIYDQSLSQVKASCWSLRTRFFDNEEQASKEQEEKSENTPQI